MHGDTHSPGVQGPWILDVTATEVGSECMARVTGCWSRFSEHVIKGWKKLSKMHLYHAGHVMQTVNHCKNYYIIACISPRWLAAFGGLAAICYWCRQEAVPLIECTPPSDYYISAHYQFFDVQFSSNAANVWCVNQPNSTFFPTHCGVVLPFQRQEIWRHPPLEISTNY